MTTAKLAAGFCVASISAILVAFALSRRASMEAPPRLEVTWTFRSRPTEPIVTKRLAENAPVPIAPAPTAPVPRATAPAPAAQKDLTARVEERLKDHLTQDLYDSFELFLYVSKAASGPWAQQMYVFRKETDGDLALLYHWPVSTGRERVEITAGGARLSTHTPLGYYELDPDRFYSRQEPSEAQQPISYTMFFNWQRRGHLTGLAIHSASGKEIAELGSRASAGGIRLSPDAARTLYALIRDNYRGTVPRFAVDRLGTMSNRGIIIHDTDGKPDSMPGYEVLVFIDNYGGRNIVAGVD